jgi:hypothetical protein
VAEFIDLAKDALMKIGAYAPGEIIDDADAELALNTADTMLDSWSTESLSCFATIEQSIVLIPTIAQYSVGPGGAINGTRPIRLKTDPGAAYLLDNNGSRYLVQVVEDQSRWNLLTGNTQVDANVPLYIFLDPQYPLAQLRVWPVPNQNWTLYFGSFQQLTDFSSISGAFSFPPGYKKAIQDCLAVELWPYFYKGEAPPQILLSLAATSKGNVKRSNIKECIAIYDPELVSRGGGTYNVYTDQSR